MAATTAFITQVLNHLFLNSDIPLIGDATGLRGSTTPGTLYLSLHTASPGVGGSQTTNECSFTGYARVAVSRDPDTAEWELSGNDMVNAIAVTFPENTGSSQTATYMGLGTAATGAGALKLFMPLSAATVIATGVSQNYAAGEIVFRVT